MAGPVRRLASGTGRRIRDIARFGRWGVLPHYIFVVVVLLTLVFATALPLKRLVEERHREADLRQQVAETKSESARLQGEIDKLTDPAVVEEQARERLGLVRPGETPMVGVEGPLPDPSSTVRPKPTRSPSPVASTPAPAPSPPSKQPTSSPKPSR